MLLSQLKPNSASIAIYGEIENIDDLVEDIRTNGLLTPLVVDETDTIVSGHRRVAALKAVGTMEIPDSLIHRVIAPPAELLVSYNTYREKTNVQRLREAQYIEWCLEQKNIRGKPKYDEIRKRTKLTPKAYIDGKAALAHMEGLPNEEKTLFEAQINRSIGAARQATRIPTHWDNLKVCAYQLEAAYNKMSRALDGQSPVGLTKLVEDIRSMAARIRTWSPDAMTICESCGGQGYIERNRKIVNCHDCFNGRRGQ